MATFSGVATSWASTRTGSDVRLRLGDRARFDAGAPPICGRVAGAIVVLLAVLGCDSAGNDDANGGGRVERLSVVSNGEVVGQVIATLDGRRVSIDYDVDDNGRGPNIDETLQLTDDGYPVDWEITGSSLFGAEVAESYSYQQGVARWASQADAGREESSSTPLYVANDASPWSLGVYARALLNAPDGSLPVLPSGLLSLEELEETTLGDDRTPVTVYALKGISLSPQLIALDADRRLFAQFGGRGVVVREGYEDAAPRLHTMARRLSTDRIRDMQSRLAHRYDAPVRIDDVRVFDAATGTLGEPVSVLVRDGRIAAVDAPRSAGGPAGEGDGAAEEVVVDGEGGTLLPGLFDMHAHNSLSSGLFYLAAGVTSTRDMGNDNDLLDGIVAGIEGGELPGPRITRAGLIEARSPYSARIGIIAEDLEEALEAVDWYAERGYPAIKTYNSMKPEWVAPLVERAGSHGMRVSGHVPAFMSPDEVIALGYDSIAHINQLMLGWLLAPDEDTRTPLRLTGMQRAADLDLESDEVQHSLDLMVEHGTSQDTTAVILERLMLSRQGEVPPGDEAYLAHMPIGYQRYRKRTFVPLEEPGDDAAYQAAFETVLDTVAMLHERGIPLLVGTDDDTGFTVHRELELYVEAGIPPAETLTLATLGAARYLDQASEVGSIEAGKAADFFLVPGNPLEDISAVRQIRLVSRGGTLYFPDEIYEALGIEPFAPAANVHVPEAGE